MEIDCQKYNCTKCCEKYWINFTFSEAKEISSFLAMNFKDFIEKKTVIVFQVFYVNSGKSIFLEEAKDKVLIVPVRALLKGKKCVFLENKKCLIYEKRPGVCRLFPDIGGGNLKTKYLFCPFLQENSFSETKDWEKYSDNLKDSFRKTLDFSLWSLPKNNFIYFPHEEKEIKITQKRTKEIIELIK